MPALIPGPPYPFRLRNSRIHGRGAFATQLIPAGTRIIEYKGERISNEMADLRYPDTAERPHHTFLFSIDDEVVVDAAYRGNASRWINQSGVSGHAFDEHYDDQTELWATNQMLPFVGSRAAVEAATADRLELVPGG